MSGSSFCSCAILFLSLHNLVVFSSAKTRILTESANLTTLRLVQIIARHGDRSPILPYPNDLYRDASVYSINGWGELSEIGARQVYELGVYLRQRYDGYLPRKYRKRDFLMLSSDIDRAIMSAEANLAGLYELGPLPRSRDIFKEWQPVPIHTIPQEEDNLINGKAECPLYSSLYKQYFASEEYANFLEDNRDFINFVTEQSGLAAITKNFQEIFQVQDALRCQYLHNLTLPSWVNITVYERLQYFKALSFVWNVRTEEMQRLKIGPMFQRLVENMLAKVEASNLILNSEDDVDETGEKDEIIPYADPVAYRKMYVFSGHDSTISALLHSLNLFQPPHIPPYAAALIIELHNTPRSGDFFVELLYKNDTTNEPFKLDLAGVCNSDGAAQQCAYQDFVKLVQKFVPKDWKAECQLDEMHGSLFAASQLNSLKNGVPNEITLDPQSISWGAQNGNLKSPLGIIAPGLPGFVLAVTAALSLLASIALLSFFFRKKVNGSQFPMSSMVYQHLS